MVIAIIGASTDRKKYGNKAVRAWKKAGTTVVPVNPNASIVEGISAVGTVLDYPGTIDMASLYVPPHIGIRVLDQLAEKGVTEVYINPGAESEELVQRAIELGLRPIIGCSIIGAGFRPSDFADE